MIAWLISVSCACNAADVGGGSPTPTSSPIPPVASPREVAEIHYRALVEGNWDLWGATLTADNRAAASRRGSSPSFWWDTGRRYVTEYGVTYRFNRSEGIDETHVKLFFDRLGPDGTPRGMPVPIHLVLEDERWRVSIASY